MAAHELTFFFNDTATTEIYTLSLHDALPICYVRSAIVIQLRLLFSVKGHLGWKTKLMATASHLSGVTTIPTRLPGRRYDHWFFSVMALLLAAAVFAGFARTYYLAGMFHAPLPSLIIHLHGAAFSIWIGLFVTQTALVSAQRVDLHRRLGVVAFMWACLMIVLGVLAALDALARGAPPFRDPRSFFIVPLGDMAIFATLIFFAFRNRTNPAVHKRLLVIATVGLSVDRNSTRFHFEVFLFRPTRSHGHLRHADFLRLPQSPESSRSQAPASHCYGRIVGRRYRSEEHTSELQSHSFISYAV